MLSLKSLSRMLVLMVLMLGTLGAMVGCSGQNASGGMAMPDYVTSAPPRVRDAYQYAIDHPDDLKTNPCYCGCGNMGHQSNLECFVKEQTENAETIFDNHAVGCGICVDIAQDTMRLRAEGKSAAEVRAYIDTTYSGFGPGTDTPLPQE
jgi:hypothetical protein